jgi:hypothetical protein
MCTISLEVAVVLPSNDSGPEVDEPVSIELDIICQTDL